MLSDAQLPSAFWAEALSMATYLRNLSPTKAVKDMTPFEAWKQKKPTVAHVRAFGCKAYAHIPKDERGKLGNKARLCTFVGYGEQTQGYRLYDFDKKKVFYSRDVVFCEDGCGRVNEDSQEVLSEKYLELGLSDDEEQGNEETEILP